MSCESIWESIAGQAHRAGVVVCSEKLRLARSWHVIACQPGAPCCAVAERGTPIRSLTPKLVGRTNLRAADAYALVGLFLSHWRYKGDPNSREIRVPTSDQYEPMLSDAEIGDVSAYIAERITVSESEPAVAATLLLPGQSTFELIVKEFQDSTALITAATGRPVLLTSEETGLMDTLWTMERSDNRPRILIWTVDLGRRAVANAL